MLETYQAYQGDNGLWGVLREGGVIYDPDFTETTARRIAQLENQDCPPKDWEETRRILESEGFEI